MANATQDPQTKLTVLISGNGSNLQALIDACNTSLPATTIVRVISSRKDAFGLKRAEKAGIATAYHNLVSYKKKHPATEEGIASARSEYDRDLASLVLADNPDMVVCAGWMHILAPTFLDPLEKAGVPVINLHPALPGQFNGAHAIDRAYAAFQEGKIEHTGIMIHYVISEVDMGQPILTRNVEIKKSDTLDQLEERIHSNEWELIVQGTRQAAEMLHSSRKASGGS
ncbi:hypothetical protein MBLNU457_3614t1 [Dothideomycetes sp. NU457]